MKDNLLNDLKSLLIDSMESNSAIKAGEEDVPVEATIEEFTLNTPSSDSYRVYNLDECDKLSVNCRNFLMNVEQMGLIDSNQREQIIDKLMQSEAVSVTMDEVRWTVLSALDNNNISDERLLFLDYVLNEDKQLKQ